MSLADSAPRPSFLSPPLVERVLAVQFDPLPRLTAAHLGLYWRTLGPDWSIISEAPPIEQIQLAFGEQMQWLPGLRIGLRAGTFRTRLRIERSTTGAMVQVQNGWFVYNWRSQPDAAYPRYERVRDEFNEYLSAFRTFLKSEGLADPRPTLWEVTYVNHVRRGPLWSTASDWPRVLPGLLAPVPERGLQLEDAAGGWDFEIRPRAGRLNVQVAPASSPTPDSTPAIGPADILAVTLTSRGPITDGWAGLPAGMNVGHGAVVDAFVAITSRAAHAEWGRQ